MSNTQTLTDSIFEAAAAKFVGYPTRHLAAEGQYAIIDTGDLPDFLLDLREHKQGVTDMLGLLECYTELRKQAGEQSTVTLPTGEASVLRPMKKVIEEGREWTTSNSSDAILLLYLNYPLLRSRVEGNGKVAFVFGFDSDLKATLAKANRGELFVEVRAFAAASYEIRNSIREAKQWRAAPPMASGFSNQEAS